jgi:hypothetical protein
MSVVSVCGLSDSSADISAYLCIVNPGDEITVTYSGAPGFELDWIAMYKVGDPNEEEYDMGYYLAGKKSGTLIFTAPDEPGDYEFRLFEDDGYTDIARSNVVTVQEGTSVSTPTPTPTPTTPTEGGLVGYWNFNEGSGNIAYDSSGSGNDGTIHGATRVDNGSCEKALSFDGVDDYVETDPATFQSNDITVEAWIYPKSFSSYKCIVHKGDRIGANNLLFAFDLISNKISFFISSNGNNWDSTVGTTNLELNKWYHVVGVYRSSDKFFAVYVNGTEDNSKSSTLSSLYHDDSKYWIGARYDNSQFRSDRYFKGIIDEVRIYDRALSEEEIQADMNKCAPTSTIAPPEISGKGDCNGDGKITAADALCALQMAVGKRAEDLVMDVNGDGRVTSLDARKILRIAAGLEEFP